MPRHLNGCAVDNVSAYSNEEVHCLAQFKGLRDVIAQEPTSSGACIMSSGGCGSKYFVSNIVECKLCL